MDWLTGGKIMKPEKKKQYFMGKSPWFPVKILPVAPVCSLSCCAFSLWSSGPNLMMSPAIRTRKTGDQTFKGFCHGMPPHLGHVCHGQNIVQLYMYKQIYIHIYMYMHNIYIYIYVSIYIYIWRFPEIGVPLVIIHFELWGFSRTKTIQR